jgi:hypothetical protein
MGLSKTLKDRILLALGTNKYLPRISAYRWLNAGDHRYTIGRFSQKIGAGNDIIDFWVKGPKTFSCGWSLSPLLRKTGGAIRNLRVCFLKQAAGRGAPS